MHGFSDLGTAQAMAAPMETDEFDRLAILVHEVTGFRDGPAFRNKLKTILGGADEDTAATWLRRLGRRFPGTGEWQSVVERLTVPETFFFRDAPQLEVLRYRILPEMILRKKRAGRMSIRMWSAGCSTGEEPYTLAMLVLDALCKAGEAREEPGGGIQVNPGWVVMVQGSDINGRVVEQARDGVYSDFGLSPFRDTPADFRRFFQRVGGAGDITRYRVRDDVRASTFFGIHNLTETPVGDDFDLVSCRNVLIYFDDSSKAAALGNLRRAIHPEGYLMLGPTDPFDHLPDFALLDPRVSPILSKRRR